MSLLQFVDWINEKKTWGSFVEAKVKKKYSIKSKKHLEKLPNCSAKDDKLYREMLL